MQISRLRYKRVGFFSLFLSTSLLQLNWWKFNLTVKTKVDNVNELQIQIMHKTEGKLADEDFQNMITRVEMLFSPVYGLR